MERSLRYGRCRALLGVELETLEIDSALTRLGLERISGDDATSTWHVPGYRGDLVREVDLIEEVIRLLGIERVTGHVGGEPAPSSTADAAYDAAMDLRLALRGMGYSEARTSTLVARPHAGDNFLELRNPLGEEQSALRPSMLGGLFAAVRRNFELRCRDGAPFEIGRVFANTEEEEVPSLSLVATGRARRTRGGTPPGRPSIFSICAASSRLWLRARNS